MSKETFRKHAFAAPFPAHHYYARAARECEQHKEIEARKTLDIALRYYRDNGDLWLEYGKLLEKHYPEESGRARNCFKRACRLNPDHLPTLMQTAGYMSRHGYRDYAESLFARVWFIETDKTIALTALGSHYRRTAQFAFAAACYGKAASSATADNMALNRYQALTAIQGVQYSDAVWHKLERRLTNIGQAYKTKEQIVPEMAYRKG